MVRELDRLRFILMRCVIFIIVPLLLAALTFSSRHWASSFSQQSGKQLAGFA